LKQSERVSEESQLERVRAVGKRQIEALTEAVDCWPLPMARIDSASRIAMNEPVKTSSFSSKLSLQPYPGTSAKCVVRRASVMRFIVPFEAGVMVRERGKAAAKESGRVIGGGRLEGEGGA
jgi:hypothetical protein